MTSWAKAVGGLVAGVILFAGQSALALSDQKAAPYPEEHNVPLMTPDGVVSWDALADFDVEISAPAPFQTIYTKTYRKEVAELNGETVKLQGFMFPLRGAEEHSYFLLTAWPPGCPFCLPGGPNSMVEVKSDEPIRYTHEPITLEGTFEILEDDPSGLNYRLAKATSVH